MKIKNLLLGSVVAMGLSTGAAFAADPLGVLTSLDVCDSLGISGLTISSDTNCLAISGSVTFEYGIIWEEGDNSTDEINDLAWDLTFDAANSTEFGPAHAIITLENADADAYDDGNGQGPAPWYEDDNSVYAFGNVAVTEAYVSIGDQTVIAAGLKTTIVDDYQTTGYVTTKRTYFETNLDGDLSFRRSNTRKVGGSDNPSNGGIGLSVVHQFGDGFSAGIALEDITFGTDNSPDTSLVGFVGVEQEMWSGFIAASLDEITNDMDAFDVAAGVEAEFDIFSFKAGGYYSANDWDSSEDYLQALVTAQAELDIVTLAGEFYYQDEDAANAGGAELRLTGSASFGVTEDAEIAFAIRYIDSEDDGVSWVGEAQVVADITDTLEATAQGFFSSDNYFGAEGSLVWNPDGDDNFEASLYAGFNNYYHDNSTFYVGTSLEKAFE